MITIEELCADNQKLVDMNLKLRKENAELKDWAKTVVQDLLDNSDEYARQRAMDFLEE